MTSQNNNILKYILLILWANLHLVTALVLFFLCVEVRSMLLKKVQKRTKLSPLDWSNF